MNWRLALALALTLLMPSAESATVLTAPHVCNALASAGFNPGAIRDGFMLRSLSCSGGGQDFVVRIHIEPMR